MVAKGAPAHGEADGVRGGVRGATAASERLASALRVAGGARLGVTGVRRRVARRAVGPGLEIIDGIDDAAAELAEGRPLLWQRYFSSVRAEMPRRRAAS